MLEYQQSLGKLGVEDMKHHVNLKKKLLKDNVGVWEERLSKEEKEFVYSRIVKELRELNYV
jgi:hypothetical protein